MSIAKVVHIILVVLVVSACSLRSKKEPINPELLSGRYYCNIAYRDSIFVYDDSSYEYRFYRLDGGIDSFKGKWEFRPEFGSIFFDGFRFYTEEGPTGFSKGTWSPKVILTEEGVVTLRYSEDIYYVNTRKRR